MIVDSNANEHNALNISLVYVITAMFHFRKHYKIEKQFRNTLHFEMSICPLQLMRYLYSITCNIYALRSILIWSWGTIYVFGVY